MTLKEIAAEVGVSPSTVSLVLNRREGVNEETRRHVLEALERNGYPMKKPRAPGRTEPVFLVKYTAHGMIVEENQGFIAAIVDQIAQCCLTQGVELCMRVCDRDSFETVLRDIGKARALGVIVIGTELDEGRAALLRKLRHPLVVVDNSLRGQGLSTVLMANEDIAAEAVRHLADCGFRDIGYLCSSVSIHNFQARRAGYEQALAALGCRRGLRIALTPTLERAHGEMQAYLSTAELPRPAAFFADNDTIAIGALRAMQEAGYRIPEDVSVIGVDNIPFSAVNTPPLTTVNISRKELGTQAMALLLLRAADPSAPPVRIEVGGELLLRKSTRTAEALDKREPGT